VVIWITASSDNVEIQHAHGKLTIRAQLHVSAFEVFIIHLSTGLRFFTLRIFPTLFPLHLRNIGHQKQAATNGKSRTCCEHPCLSDKIHLK
jgi:hypothetical protein